MDSLAEMIKARSKFTSQMCAGKNMSLMESHKTINISFGQSHLIWSGNWSLDGRLDETPAHNIFHIVNDEDEFADPPEADDSPSLDTVIPNKHWICCLNLRTGS
jgi:hypothetical protein